MKKLWLGAGALVALVVTGVVAAPYWSGTQIEEHFRAVVDSSSQGGFATEIQSYERGMTESKAVTVTRILLPEEEPLEFVVDHVMDHGPKLGQLAVARIDSRLRVPAADTDGLLKSALDGEPLLTVVTHVQADGSQKLDVSSPAFEIENPAKPGERLAFGGIAGGLDVTPGGEAVKGSLNAPTIAMTSEVGAFEVNSVAINADMTTSEVPSLWFGTADMTAASMRFTPGDGGELQPVVVDGLRFASVTRDGGETVDIAGGYEVDQIAFAGESVSAVALKFSLNSLSRSGLAEYVQTATRIQQEAMSQDPVATESYANEMLASFGKIVTQGSAVANLDRLGFAFRGGRLDGKGAVRYTGSGDLGAFNPFTDLKASATLKGTREMVRDIVSEVLATQQYGARLSALPDEERNAVVGATQFQIDALVKQGFVAETGEDYVVEAAFDPNGLFVNGAPIPLPQAGPAPAQ